MANEKTDLKTPTAETIRTREASPTTPASKPDVLSAKSASTVLLCLLGVFIYTAATLGILIWMITSPILRGGRVVLRTGTLHVDQFYSGVALSALLTPAAIITRTLGYELGLLHPFAIAARKPVKVSDIDKMMDPGIFTIPSILRYSRWTALVQIIFAVSGALLVPVGTLVATVETYSPQTQGTAVVGMPTLTGNTASLDEELSGFPFLAADPPAPLDSIAGDQFAWNVANLASSVFIVQTGNLSVTPPILGPIETGNFSFETGVKYHGLVIYTWSANCEDATDEIQYEYDAGFSSISYTFPDGSVNYTSLLPPQGPWLYMWSNTTERAGSAFFAPQNAYLPEPFGGTIYLATAAYGSDTMSYPDDSTGLTKTPDVWVSRVKCTPRISWTVGSCEWDGTAMSKCSETPGRNVTALSVEGLNKLSGYMTAGLWAIYSQENVSFGTTIVSLPILYWPEATNSARSFRAPSLAEYEKMFGVIASSIAKSTSMGYYGTAEVPTTGEPARRVYIGRLYVVAIVLLILIFVTSLGCADLFYFRSHRLPFRKASFLTTAIATRGRWWDEGLDGNYALSQSQLRQSHLGQQYVRFGEDISHPGRINFSPIIQQAGR